MNPYSFVKRNSKPVVPLVLVILGLMMGIAYPASGLKDGEPEGVKTTKPDIAGPQALALNNHAANVSVANVTPEVFYYHQDATGNLAAMTDDGGQVVWQVDVRPFGQGSPSSTDHPLRFAGQPQEPSIGGLYHLGARMYDPLTGRFLSPDPFLLAAVMRDNPQRYNQYSYALNNPYRYHDASGLQGTEITASDSLKKFLDFYSDRLGSDPDYASRKAAFPSGMGVGMILNQKPGSASIRNRAGQAIFLWEAAVSARSFVEEAEKDKPLWGSYTADDIANKAKANAREAVEGLYLDIINRMEYSLFSDDGTFNRTLMSGIQAGHKVFIDLGAQIRGLELLIDYMVYGGDLRDYFDPKQLPPQKKK
jgi:RHS repeat-associated protein